MKKLRSIFYFLVCFLVGNHAANAQWYAVPDTNFRNKLISLGYTNCMNASHDSIDGGCTKAISTFSLFIDNANIKDISGVEVFRHLTTLDCSYNKITFINHLPSHLQSLYCYDDSLTTLHYLPSSLIRLQCNNNKINHFDSLPSNLAILQCANNKLFALPNLPNSLTELFCDNDPMDSLPTLNAALQYLSCTNIPLYKLPVLPSFLQQLYCDNDSLDSLPHLPNSLLVLSCDNNQIVNLPLLPDSIYTLHCSHNQIVNLPTLPNLLNDLDCSHNLITCLPKLPNNLNEYSFVYDTSLIKCTPNYPIGADYWLKDKLPLCMNNNLNNCLVLCNNSSTINQFTCSHQTFTFHHQVLTSNGVYLDTLTNHLGCDSVITLNLAFVDTLHTTLHQFICLNDSFYFNGHFVFNAGIYEDSLISYGGCDSIVTLYLSIHQPSLSTINQGICVGDTLNFHGQFIFTAGIYHANITNHAGCDSSITLHLAVYQPSSSTLNISILQGDDIFFGGKTLTTAGVYFDTIANFRGCDSVVQLNLSVSTGISNLEASHFSVFPNPTHQSIHINCEFSINKIEINNLLGQPILTENENLNAQNISVNVAEMPNGIYFLQLFTTDGKVLNGKFIKE